jgi:hypothetical protein
MGITKRHVLRRLWPAGVVIGLLLLGVVLFSVTAGVAAPADQGVRGHGTAILPAAGKPSPTPTASYTPPALPTFPQASKPWTIMVYMDGDNNLEDYIVKDLESELSLLGSNANVNVVALADRGPGYDTSRGDWQTTKLYYCQQGMQADAASAVADWGERNMGDPQTLKDFVAWTKANCPASHYMLAFWDHGWLWFPGWTMKDDSSAGDCLNDDEQRAAMQTAGPVDVVAWDCCSRMVIEVAADWRPYAKAMAGSEEYTNWEGIQYDAVIAALRTTPTMTANQVSDKVALTALGDSLCFSSIALDARFDTLVTAVDQWSLALTAGLPTYRAAYDAAWRAAQGFNDATEKDLYDAAAQVKAKVADANIKAKCDAVMTACAAVETANWTNGRAAQANAKGLAIWWPATAAKLNTWGPTDWSYYRTSELFASQTHWDEFLAAYCQ